MPIHAIKQEEITLIHSSIPIEFHLLIVLFNLPKQLRQSVSIGQSAALL
jgi:hypothetical protein